VDWGSRMRSVARNVCQSVTKISSAQDNNNNNSIINGIFCFEFVCEKKSAQKWQQQKKYM